MAKFYGSAVKTGKLGGSVFAIRYGEVIERQYQPVVANPSTPAQVEARAKMKLMSQLGAVMAPVIAIPRSGAASSRNLFVKLNYPGVQFADDEAEVNLSRIQLTKSVVGLPAVVAVRGTGTAITIDMQVPLQGFNRVVYALFIKQSDGKLRFAKSQVVSEGGTNNTYPWETTLGALDSAVVYAYAVRDNNERAKAVFGNMEVPTAEDVARLLVTRSLLENDVTLTETQGVEIAPAS